MPIIAIAPCRQLADYVESVRRAGGEPSMLDPGTSRADAVVGRVDGAAADRRRRRRPGALRRAAAPDVHGRRARPRRVRDRAGRGRALDADLPMLRDLPRHAGAERRARRHARAGHPVRGATARSHHAVREPRYAIAHEVWVTSGVAAGGADARRRSRTATRCQVNSRHHQAVQARRRRASTSSATAPDGVIEAIERPDRALLPRRAVAPGELLAHRRVPAAVRGLRRGGARKRDQRSRVTTASTCAVRGNRSTPRIAVRR